MADVTYYVALPFVASDDGVAAGEPTECFNPNAAVMRAEALSRTPPESLALTPPRSVLLSHLAPLNLQIESENRSRPRAVKQVCEKSTLTILTSKIPCSGPRIP
jgi:hypothetical protein